MLFGKVMIKDESLILSFHFFRRMLFVGDCFEAEGSCPDHHQWKNGRGC